MKASPAVSINLIEQTHKVWQPRIRRKLTDEDARQIAENVTGFFAILTEWTQSATPVLTNNTTLTAHTDMAEVGHDR